MSNKTVYEPRFSVDWEQLGSRPESDPQLLPDAGPEAIADQALGCLIYFGTYREDLVQEAAARGHVYERLEQEPEFPLHQTLQRVKGVEMVRQLALSRPETGWLMFERYCKKLAHELEPQTNPQESYEPSSERGK